MILWVLLSKMAIYIYIYQYRGKNMQFLPKITLSTIYHEVMYTE